MNNNLLENINQEDLNRFKKEFEKKIFQDLHLENLPPEEKEKFLDKLTDSTNQAILSVVMENLNEEQVAEIEKKMQAATTDEEKDQIMVEAAKNIQDLEKKIMQELDSLYSSLVQVASGFKKE